jgi:hypothetical protein
MIVGIIQGSTGRQFGYRGLLLTLLLTAAIPATSADDRVAETIDATAMGTSTQMGRNVSVKLVINRFSTQEDREELRKSPWKLVNIIDWNGAGSKEQTPPG